MRILAIALTLTSCGLPGQSGDYVDRRVQSSSPAVVPADNPPLIDNPDVDKWTKLFYDEVKAAGLHVNDNVKMRLAGEDEFKETVIGTCTMYTTFQDVKLRTVWWDKSPDCQRGLLVIHELGHCALNLDHSDTGVMTPYIQPECEDGDAEKALTELLTNIKKEKP